MRIRDRSGTGAANTLTCCDAFSAPSGTARGVGQPGDRRFVLHLVDGYTLDHRYPSRPLEVVNADLIIEVTADDQKFGELQVSRGSIDWVPRDKQTARSLTWEKFAQLMDEHGS